MAVAAMLLISAITFAQTIEERKGGSSTYSVAAGDPLDELTWTIAADVAPVSVNPVPDLGSGTIADPYIINYTPNLTSITVQWAADLSPGITSTAGTVSVQKRSVGSIICESPVQTMDIDFWSLPTASISDADLEICSGEAIGGSITINLTGAPDGAADGFEVDYAISAPNLEDGSGTSWDGISGTETTDGSTVTILLPDELNNLSTSSETFTITLTRMNDDFTGDGGLIDDTYNIVVHPIPTTGIITSTGVLARR